MIRLAAPDEFTKVRDFYHCLIDDMPKMRYHPMWEKGIYPSDAQLRAALADGELYLYTDGDELLAAMRVNHLTTEGYDRVRWQVDASPAEVTVIHMLAVAYRAQGAGLAKQMVRFVLEKAAREGGRAVRLDVLFGNLPAFKLYEGLGFQKVGTVKLFYEDTGLTDFALYEYLL